VCRRTYCKIYAEIAAEDPGFWAHYEAAVRLTDRLVWRYLDGPQRLARDWAYENPGFFQAGAAQAVHNAARAGNRYPAIFGNYVVFEWESPVAVVGV